MAEEIWREDGRESAWRRSRLGEARDIPEEDLLGGGQWGQRGQETGAPWPDEKMVKILLTLKWLKYCSLLLYHEKMAVTRAAWIRKKGVIPSWGFW